MKAVLYCRVSTGKQFEKNLSIPDQLKQLREYCTSQGYTIHKEFIEDGASATDDRRPVFQEMIAEAMEKDCPRHWGRADAHPDGGLLFSVRSAARLDHAHAWRPAASPAAAEE